MAPNIFFFRTSCREACDVILCELQAWLCMLKGASTSSAKCSTTSSSQQRRPQCTNTAARDPLQRSSSSGFGFGMNHSRALQRLLLPVARAFSLQWQRRAHEHLAHRPQGQLLALLLDDAHAERARRLAAEETHEGFVFVNTRVAHGAPIARRPATWQQGSTRVHGGGGGALSDGIRSCRRVGPASAGVARPPARTVDAHRCARGCCR